MDHHQRQESIDMATPPTVGIPTTPEERKFLIDNHLASSKLDGKVLRSTLAKRQIEIISNHQGSEEELKARLLAAYEG